MLTGELMQVDKLTQTASDLVVPWSLDLALVGGIILGLGSMRRFATGWGDAGRRLENQPAWRSTLISIGFAVMPVTCGMTVALLGLNTARLFLETDFDGFGVLSVLLLACSPACMVWGLFEARRPNRWRRIPPWLIETRNNGTY